MGMWQKRIIRLWLLVILPLAIYVGYQAYDSHLNISFWQDHINKMLEQKHDLTKSMYTPQELRELIDESVIERDKNVVNKNNFTILSVILFCFPIIVWLIIHANKWIWHGKKT